METIQSEPTAITHRRPAWLNDGIVIAGNWSSLMARQQRIGAMWTQMGYGLSNDVADICYRQETSAAMADRLQADGITLVILPLWSGMGSYEDELPGMEDSRRFAALLQARGMRVGVYIHNMNLSLGFLTSRPDACEWLAWTAPDSPFPPPPPHTESEGHPVYRNHPDYLRFMYGVIDYAVKEVKADYLHFDNFVNATGFSPRAIADFRSYLRMKYAADELRRCFGSEHLEDVGMLAHRQLAPAWQEWQYFQAWSLGEAYRKLAGYARLLNPEVATDVNASGLNVGFRRPIDLSILIPHGDAFWDEQSGVGWDSQKRLLRTCIRTYKLGRLFHQGAILYTRPGLTACQALAFNYDLLGCMTWFLYGRVEGIFGTASGEGLSAEVRFYRAHRELFANGETLADVAVLRGRAVNLCGPAEAVGNAYLFEQAMICQHIPFELIFDQHLDNLKRYPVVALPDVRLLDDGQIDALLRYVEQGGGLLVTDQTAAQNSRGEVRDHPLQRFFRRTADAAADMFEARGRGRILHARVLRPPEVADGSLPLNDRELAAAVVRLMGAPSLRTDAPPWVAMECVRQPGRYVIHLLNCADGCTGVPVQLWVSARLGTVRCATWLSPYTRETQLTVDTDAACSRIVVPPFKLYAVVVAACIPLSADA